MADKWMEVGLDVVVVKVKTVVFVPSWLETLSPS